MSVLDVVLMRAPREALLRQLVVLERDLAHEQAAHEETRKQRDYWQKRAELYIDRAAARTGVSHEPVMRELQTLQDEVFVGPLSGAGISEIEKD